MKVSELIKELNRIYPESFQENYDNTGQQVIFPEKDLALPFTGCSVDEATKEIELWLWSKTN